MSLRRLARATMGALAFFSAAVAAGLAARHGPQAAELTGPRAGRIEAGDVARGAGELTGVAAEMEASGEAAPLDARRGSDVRRKLDHDSRGTYIDEVLRGRDSSLARWPDRSARPLTVWVQTPASLPGWQDGFANRARDAFGQWELSGVPLRFTFVADSASADVHLTWVDRFDEPISGKTLWARDDRWWIVSADIVLALHHRDGSPLDQSAMHAIALHEVGHLVGLDHTRDGSNIMAPRVRVRELSAADRATARLLYSVPPGRVR